MAPASGNSQGVDLVGVLILFLMNALPLSVTALFFSNTEYQLFYSAGITQPLTGTTALLRCTSVQIIASKNNAIIALISLP